MFLKLISNAAYCGLFKKNNKDNFTISHGSLKNVFSLFEFSFTWGVSLFGGRDWVWQEDCHKRMVREACAVSPGEGGLSLTVSFLGFINGFLPHLAVNLRPKEFTGPPNARNTAWLMKRGRHNPVSSFLKTTLKWSTLARKLKQCTDLNHHQSYFPWFGRILRHFAIWITKHYLCIF